MEYLYVGRNELVALVVGLVTGFLYSLLNLPIPAPNVLGGILAIIFTFAGYVIVKLVRKQITFGRPGVRGVRAET
jgi:XapX domain-containing protein